MDDLLNVYANTPFHERPNLIMTQSAVCAHKHKSTHNIPVVFKLNKGGLYKTISFEEQCNFQFFSRHELTREKFNLTVKK